MWTEIIGGLLGGFLGKDDKGKADKEYNQKLSKAYENYNYNADMMSKDMTRSSVSSANEGNQLNNLLSAQLSNVLMNDSQDKATTAVVNTSRNLFGNASMLAERQSDVKALFDSSNLLQQYNSQNNQIQTNLNNKEIDYRTNLASMKNDLNNLKTDLKTEYNNNKERSNPSIFSYATRLLTGERSELGGTITNLLDKAFKEPKKKKEVKDDAK